MSTRAESNQKEREISLKIYLGVVGYWKLVGLFSLIFLIWLASYYIIKAHIPVSLRGTFGDTFGAINSLFSGLAFAGIIYTILLQRDELHLQREELKSTREELKRSADAQEKT
jgi:hypothetical protein